MPEIQFAADPQLVQELLSELHNLITAINGQQPFLTKWLPALVGSLSALAAICVGALSFVAAKRQIRATQETALAQIKSAQELAITKIRADLVAASRKEWIEELRESISKIISRGNKFHSTFRLKQKIDDIEFYEFWTIEAHVRLMLNDEPPHLKLIETLQTYISTCGTAHEIADLGEALRKLKSAKDDLIRDTRSVLRPEWKKVTSIE